MNAGPAEFNKIGGVEVATEMPDDIKFEVPIPAKVMGRFGLVDSSATLLLNH